MKTTSFFAVPLALLLLGCGTAGQGDEGRPLSSHLKAPYQLEATAGNLSVTLQWEEPPMAQSFLLYFGNTPELGEIQPVEGPTFLVEDLSNEVTYYFAIASVSAMGEISHRSEMVSATPSPQPHNENEHIGR